LKSERVKLEIAEIIEFANEKLAKGEKDLQHLSNVIGVTNYIRIADRIKGVFKSGKILDWGCGFGQMSYLLNNRGLDVVAYNVKQNVSSCLLDRIKYVVSDEELKLPFNNEQFDAVLSCGVLEHVQSADESLCEISRILRQRGYFFTFMLPNKLSYTEFISDVRGISAHPVKYSVRSIEQLYRKHGFRIIEIRRSNMIPRNLTGLPSFIKKIYSKFYIVLNLIDRLLSSLPLVNSVAGVFEVIAVKEG